MRGCLTWWLRRDDLCPTSFLDPPEPVCKEERRLRIDRQKRTSSFVLEVFKVIKKYLNDQVVKCAKTGRNLVSARARVAADRFVLARTEWRRRPVIGRARYTVTRLGHLGSRVRLAARGVELGHELVVSAFLLGLSRTLLGVTKFRLRVGEFFTEPPIFRYQATYLNPSSLALPIRESSKPVPVISLFLLRAH